MNFSHPSSALALNRRRVKKGKWQARKRSQATPIPHPSSVPSLRLFIILAISSHLKISDTLFFYSYLAFAVAPRFAFSHISLVFVSSLFQSCFSHFHYNKFFLNNSPPTNFFISSSTSFLFPNFQSVPPFTSSVFHLFSFPLLFLLSVQLVGPFH